MKWPLQFFYASNIPVILAAALIANMQLFGGLVYNAAQPCMLNATAVDCTMGGKIATHFTFLGQVQNGQPVSGFLYWVGQSNIVGSIIQGSWRWELLGQALGHVAFYMLFSAIFSVFWVKTSGMDAGSQAQNILNSGLQIPGFRKDKRILESILSRYVMPLTIMGGLAIGLLAALADELGALVAGTSLMLGIMITFQFYQSISQQHSVDMNPGLKKMMGV